MRRGHYLEIWVGFQQPTMLDDCGYIILSECRVPHMYVSALPFFYLFVCGIRDLMPGKCSNHHHYHNYYHYYYDDDYDDDFETVSH